MKEDNKNKTNKKSKEEIRENTKNTNQKSKNKKTIIILFVIVLLVSIGIFVYAKIKEDNCTKPYKMVPMYDEPRDYKPIIYLYPEKDMQISVTLGNPQNITCSYPKYNNSWNVIAKTDGTLVDINTGRTLYGLYWEGMHSKEISMKDGFVVKGEDTIQFLEEKLETLGLNEREAEEFIIYWLPILQKNEYNFIRFASMEEINENMPLEFSTQPDTLIRVLMEYKALDKYIEVDEQQLKTPSRKGFIVVEWGGTEVK